MSTCPSYLLLLNQMFSLLFEHVFATNGRIRPCYIISRSLISYLID